MQYINYLKTTENMLWGQGSMLNPCMVSGLELTVMIIDQFSNGNSLTNNVDHGWFQHFVTIGFSGRVLSGEESLNQSVGILSPTKMGSWRTSRHRRE